MNPRPTAAESTDGRLVRWDEHKLQRRAHIIESAIAEVRETGPGASVTQIAKRAGLTRASVYRMFDSPERMYREIGRTITAQYLADFGAAIAAELPTIEMMAAAIHHYVEFCVNEPELYRFLSRMWTDYDERSVALPAHQTMAKIMVAAFGSRPEFAPIDGLEELAYGSIALMESAVARWVREPVDTREDRASLERRLTRWIDALRHSEATTASRSSSRTS
ncbi:hypothetical protein BOX37_13505 [Nocardia mangyaensis]|uniref:HTH tetR-type domain-containing protein n=1 Tax=Nocardia mangyaensis TaxID=2213200 RepID=A0A1J0VRZ7_9NOCA|nr:TetR/AcrR family transcriptional regulator [Nocardia mangyaensis]APE34794.1 hypothetical protein BOX37_13505 [Nocardia mangyaensis]